MTQKQLSPADFDAQHCHLVLGYGVTGKAVAAFLDFKKIPYFVAEDAADCQPNGPLCQGRVAIEKNQLVDYSNRKPISRVIHGVIVSPGVPPNHDILTWSASQNIPSVGELELASWYLPGPFLGVTGTNGKSTTVKLLHQLLLQAGVKTTLKGNIGEPLITAVLEAPCDAYVIEESSYQTEQIQKLHHRVAVCLNVTDDHFDRYDGLADYAAAKACILKNMTAADAFIFNDDDVSCHKMSWNAPTQLYPFSLVNHFSTGGFEHSGELVIRIPAGEFHFPLSDCSLKGLHNHENMLAALLSALQIKSDAAAIASYRNTLKTFQGLPHRVELVLSKDGVSYYDDSKGTNVGSVVMALAGFEGNVILIAGGKDKLGDYTPLRDLIRNKVKKLILLGEAKVRMQEAFHDVADISMVENMQAAVKTAKDVAKPGDTVLLSPACSSFDQYRNYHERGLDFQKWVKET